MHETQLVASLTSPPSDDGEELRALASLGVDRDSAGDAGVAWLEVRADLVGDLDPHWLRDRFPGGLIYTLRSKAEGGEFTGGHEARRRRLTAAAGQGYDLVDLEADRDLHEDVLGAVEPERRLASWHGPSTHLTGLKERFAELSRREARYYKLIPHAAQSGDEIRALELLFDLRRTDVICFATGDVGAWTRIVAPRLGCPLVYGAYGPTPEGTQPAAPGQMTIERLIDDYFMPHLPPIDALYGIVGKPVAHSLSPRLWNGAFRELGVPGVYLPFHGESFGDFWLEVVEAEALDALGMPLRGLSVTSPYKALALAVSGASSPRAQHIEAANTLVHHDGVWEAETTDPDGVVLALDRALKASGRAEPSDAPGSALRGTTAAVVGCGGAGKAAAYGLQLAGADVTLVNRTVDRGRTASIELRLPFEPLADFDPGSVEIVVHATGLGHAPDDPLPFDVDRLARDATVLDMVYARRATPLLEAVEAAGRHGVDGREMLLFQALEQFRLVTGRPLDPAYARGRLGLGWELPAASDAAGFDSKDER